MKIDAVEEQRPEGPPNIRIDAKEGPGPAVTNEIVPDEEMISRVDPRSARRRAHLPAGLEGASSLARANLHVQPIEGVLLRSLLLVEPVVEAHAAGIVTRDEEHVPAPDGARNGLHHVHAGTGSGILSFTSSRMPFSDLTVRRPTGFGSCPASG